MKFSTQYNHHTVPGLTCKEPSRTQKQYAYEADINEIISRYRETGIPPPVGGREPIFGDFSDDRIGDFHQALQTINGVQELMQQLPAAVRSRFKNNPAEILAFIQNPANIPEAIELGLVDKPAEPPKPAEPEKK